jgi:hypothetical protein
MQPPTKAYRLGILASDGVARMRRRDRTRPKTLRELGYREARISSSNGGC